MESGHRREGRPSFFLILILTGLAAGIIITGYSYYRNYAKNYRRAVEQQLAAIADLKVNELAQWRKERLGDAAVFYGNAAFSALVRRYFEKPDDTEASGQLRSWLRQFQEQLRYDRIFLLDAQGVARMAVPDTPEPVAAHLLKDAPEIIRSGRMSFLDFHRDAPGRPIHLSILVPILGGGADHRGLGILVLRIDPRTHLYPLISRWPTPSPTAETLLVRREGNEVVYLNELKLRKNVALNLRVALDNKDRPAVKAVLGQEGVEEAKDYRGVPVLAALRAIPDTPWFLIARIERAEADRPLRERLWLTVIIVGSLLLGTSTAVGFIWRQQRVHSYLERAKAAEALHESEEAFRALAENANDGILIAVGQGTYAYANKRASEIAGYGAAELLKTGISDLIHPDEVKKVTERYKKRLAGEPAPPQYETIIIRKDGKSVPIELSVSKRVWHGQPADIFIVHDTTERRKAEEALQRASAYNRRLIEASLDPLVTIGPDGRITDVNAATEAVTGCRREELIGTDFLDYFTEPERARAGYQQVFREGRVHDYALEVRHRDGCLTPVLYNASIYRDEEGKVQGVFAAARDITERREAEAKLDQTISDLERSNKDLEQFAYVASHDLQEPLRMVSSYTQLLAERYEGRLDDKAKKYIDYAVDGAVRMQRLINDLLTYSRIGTRGKPLEPTDAHSALGEAIKNLAATIEENRAIITNDELPTVRADASQLGQVFQNLLANAIKFRRKDLPHVHVSAQDHGREWVFSIRDNGIGIDPQYADRIFQIFQRLHTRVEYPGTGIGLAVCKRIVERHGGRIWFESEPGKGSTFFFAIPK